MDSKTTRHALIVVFDYKLSHITPNDIIMDPAGQLLSMHIDLYKAYQLAIKTFGISRRDITIVTDIQPDNHRRPWEPLKRGSDNPRIVQLTYPEITYVAREVAQFIENTVRGIGDIVSKGFTVTNEVFVYFSCHGGQLPLEINHEGEHDFMDTALILMTKRDKKYYERRYLRATDIFRLLFGHISISEEGEMIVPISRRTKIHGSTKQKAYYLFEDDEACKFQLTPGSMINSNSDRADYKTNRGLPLETQMLCVIDTCNSGTLTDFHYVYDSNSGNMKPTFRLPLDLKYPYCVSLAASENKSISISTTQGSPFTQHIAEIYATAKCSMSIREFYDVLYASIPKMIEMCKPTISSTSSDADRIMPFMSDLPAFSLSSD